MAVPVILDGPLRDVLRIAKRRVPTGPTVGAATSARTAVPRTVVGTGAWPRIGRDGIPNERARLLLPVREIATREVELWVKHVGPHYRTLEMGPAVVRWFSAMCDEGLTDLQPDAMAKFMGRLGSVQ
jgi:hypothetical protein